MVFSPAVVVGHGVSPEADALLTPEALSFLADLHRHFDPERRAAKPIQFSSSFQMFLFICRRTLLATSLKFVHFISKKIRLCY